MPTLSQLKDRVRWTDVPGYAGVRVALLTSNDMGYKQALRDALQPHVYKLAPGASLSIEVFEGARNLAIAEHLLKDWKGIDRDNGESLPFSIEAAVNLATDVNFSGFFCALARKADELAGLRT